MKVLEYLIPVGMVFLILMLVLGAWVFKSAMEAQTYRELTGVKVTTYQAMWVDLRVVEPAKQE